ncbi:MAG: hypothetical protein ABW123_03555 [Cystobacter sp.]
MKKKRLFPRLGAVVVAACRLSTVCIALSLSCSARAADVQWIGNSYIYPANGSITSSSDVWINTETHPLNSAAGARVLYSLDEGANWLTVPMTKNGVNGNNDQWHVNLGRLPCGSRIRYAIEATHPSKWDNNEGSDYAASVNVADGDICPTTLNWVSNYGFKNGKDTVSVTVSNPNTDARTYVLSSNAVRRSDAENKGTTRTLNETSGKPILRTGNPLFDGLFALAYNEMATTLSVNQISDGAYNGGKSIACPKDGGSGGCFKTGVKWAYVWTRDSAYAIDLSLAQMDPVRSANTLKFKLSDRRGNPGKPEIVQDTGSGGSWPVSTDRVVWARGAWEVLKYLNGDQRTQFRDAAYAAMVNTIENDRIAVYDAGTGLYAGEQSFLDWREQTYPSWTATNVVHIGMSKALSTNVNHWMILDVAARLATEKGDAATSTRYRGWADALKAALNNNLWLAQAGLYSMMKTTELDPSSVQRYELMGEALAVIDGIADDTKTSSILQAYPHTVAGASVAWPQIRDTPIYHNQAIWPFVSAYWLRAAVLGKNDAVVNHNLKTLIRGAGLNLSNMENFQFISLSGNHQDQDNGNRAGPVINSEAQLWSVGGYMSSVLDVVFGRQATQTGLRFQPFVTRYMRNTLFSTAHSIHLKNLPYKGKTLNVEVLLPARDGASNGYYNVASVKLNGTQVANETYFTASSSASDTYNIQIQLVDANAPRTTMTVVEDTGDYRRFWAPREPTEVSVTLSGALLSIGFNPNGETGVMHHIYRNGTRVASNLTTTRWTDPASSNYASKTLCYSVESQYVGGNAVANLSHHSDPVCYWHTGSITFFNTGAGLNSLDGASTATDHGRTHFNDWGAANQVLEAAFTPGVTGNYGAQLVYGNAFHAVNSGVTAAVKRIEVVNAAGQVVASDVLMMPQLSNWDVWGDSSFARFPLTAGATYKVRVKDFYNMSYLESNATYGGAGGSGGPVNRANVSGMKLLRLE